MNMTKRRWWALSLLMVLSVGIAVSPLRYAARGWLSGESFYAGWPVSYWMAALSDQDPGVRQRATSALAQVGANGEKAIPALIAVLDDPNAEVRWGAADALGEIGRHPEQVVPALEKMLS